jgi:CRP-like cAMP-binding protein
MLPACKPATDPRQNQLLFALIDTDWAHWLAQLEPVELRAGQVLHDAGGTQAYMYFPTTAIVSMMYMTREGQSAEVAVIGNDGVVGVSLIMGSDAAISQALVHSGGGAYRLRAQAVKTEMARSGPVFAMLLRYTQALIAQVTQTAACNRFHSIEQQFSRRLLTGLDRAASDELALTQEMAANLLGVRREGVTAAALKLQHAGAIRYSRGRISVLDRPRLEQHSCECYAATKKERVRLLHQAAPAPALVQAPALRLVRAPRPAPPPMRSASQSQPVDLRQ